MIPLKIRVIAILNCIWFGILPSCVYERKQHYESSWWEHARLNIGFARDLILGIESKDDQDFVLKSTKRETKYWWWQHPT